MKMKRNVLIMAVVVICAFAFFSGCAKKAVTKDQGLTVAEQRAPVQAAPEVKAQPAPAPAPVERPRDARELALKQDAAAATTPKAEKVEFEDIRFAFDKSVIEPAARETLNKVAAWMLKNKNYALVIEGHCDERGTVEYNLALGQRRADAAMKYLVDLGVNKADISTISYGEERPLDPRQNEEAWAKNRRANFTVKFK